MFLPRRRPLPGAPRKTFLKKVIYFADDLLPRRQENGAAVQKGLLLTRRAMPLLYITKTV